MYVYVRRATLESAGDGKGWVYVIGNEMIAKIVTLEGHILRNPAFLFYL